MLMVERPINFFNNYTSGVGCGTEVGNGVGILFYRNKKGVTFSCNPLNLLAGATRLELATSGLTGRRSNRN